MDEIGIVVRGGAFPVWRCSRGDVNDPLRGSCSAPGCEETRPCQGCGVRPARLYTTGMWCDGCEVIAPTSLVPRLRERREVVAYPAPERVGAEIGSEGLPRGPQAFLGALRGAQVDAYVVSSRGWKQDQYGRPVKLVDALTVRFQTGRGPAVATWLEDRGSLRFDRVVVLTPVGLQRGSLEEARRWCGLDVPVREPVKRATKKASPRVKDTVR